MSIRISLLAVTILGLTSAPVLAEQLGSGITDLDLSRQVTGLNQPTGAEFLPDGRLVIMQKDGRLRVQLPGGSRLIDAGTLPSRDGFEQGALGLAVDPMFTTSNRIYFYYSRGTNDNDRHAIGWTTIDPSTHQVAVNSITNILTGIYGPANHNGGGLKFGPDGYLYIGTGDTGCNCGCSPGQADNYNSTCLTNFQGKILRVDREGNIPASNPLVGMSQVKACPVGNARPCQSSEPTANNMGAPATEIYNWGFRNPWRFSWDEQTGFLWIGDVGEVTWEEITVSQGPGEHHGWPYREGAHGLPTGRCGDSTPSSGNCVDPAYEYGHNQSPAFGQGSVTAGVFSNHCSWPSNYRGKYWFGDYNKGRVWTLEPSADRKTVVSGSRETMVTSAGGPVHFFNGPDHAVYTVDIDNGRIYRIAPTNPVPCDQDAGTGPVDPVDTGVGPEDTGPPVFADASMPNPTDTGAGNSPTDASSPPPADSGTAGPADTGSSTTSAPDASTNNRPRPPAERAGSTCGCQTTTNSNSSAIFGVLLIGALFLTRRRKG